MSTFESEVRGALRRQTPPPGFEQRVMARIQRRPPRSGLRWAAIAAAVVLAAGLGVQRYTEYRDGLRAKRELMLAVHITEQKLAIAEQHVARVESEN